MLTFIKANVDSNIFNLSIQDMDFALVVLSYGTMMLAIGLRNISSPLLIKHGLFIMTYILYVMF